ncbi:hypothetical protein [Aurantimonas endophytica]|uniref:Tail assembly chaperone n=1 Tax=Aurantimonas endophytica TaxID=1522175 RepID=A0A7W6H9A6_9HYPH|nr:hypothetical protein [Aurantimonas endophytica]MBB4000968.1 hypothetical protein [Aurantimonas endophytica]MCO6403373.1 hypothetical protein [Aurantimonas endophytica]
MDISSLKRDSKKVEAGEWVGDIPGMEDVRLRVRGLSSPTVAALRSRKERKVSREGRERDGQLKTDVALVIFGEILHEAVLLEWDGITSDGKPLPFDADIAKVWLTDPDFTPFADAVVWAAQVVDKGRAGDQEEVGNGSRRPSRAT